MSNNYSTQEKAAMFDRIYSYFANPMEMDFQCKECKLSVSKAENEKLRELCADMWDWLAPTAVGSGVPMQGLYERMLKLGVEVTH